jgi:hypothetical protein
MSGEHLLNLVNDILDVSKIEAGKLELEMKPFSVTEVYRAAMGIVRPQAAAKGLIMELEIAPDLPLYARGDQQRIRGIDHQQIVDPDHGNQSVVALYMGVVRIDEDRFADCGVAVGVGLELLGDRLPGADVAPAEPRGQDHDICGLFHDRDIDRDITAGGEAGGIELDAVGGAARRADALHSISFLARPWPGMGFLASKACHGTGPAWRWHGMALARHA